MDTDENQKLKAQFNLEEKGYYDITTFVDTKVGFSFKKDFGEDKEHVSLFHLFIPNKDYEDTSLKRKPLLITAVFGKKSTDGVHMRSFSRKEISQPIDLDFTSEYFYDLKEDQLYKKNGRKITGEKLLKEIYSKHIKTTRLILGFSARLKLRFWKIWLPHVFKFISEIFYWILYIISGDRYTYTFLFKEENLNGKVISSRMEGRIGTHRPLPAGKEHEKPAKEIEFFGNKVAQWPIVFYSILHLCIWFGFKYVYHPTETIEKFFDSNFLTVVYVIVSFWFIETVIPFILKKAIKVFSTLAALSEYKKIHI